MPRMPIDKPPQNATAEEPHYHGHRERLRERFYSAGPDALSDYELLEMALFAAIPRRDTKLLLRLFENREICDFTLSDLAIHFGELF